MKAAVAVLGASLLFFLGVLTGVGRRETVPPPTAIPLGVVNTPAAPEASRPPSPADAPAGAAKRTTTTTAVTAPAPTSPTNTAGPTATTGDTTTTATTSTTAPTTSSSTATTAGSGDVEQVDNQVDCRSDRKQGKGEPCPSTTTSTGGAPGGGGNR